ncbi:ROK family protein [Hymenobacter terrenus]|uniref:ROK family protein n=1 Tax=Hymenobacter terrenus TaxID=1629124 RepID=UPI00061931DD|nr:ROK family protein [Hymenobacter terrenus]
MNNFLHNETLWGLDLGGTKIEGVILKSVHEPEVLFRDRVPTGADQGYEHVLGQIKKLVDHMEASVGYQAPAIGLATPGTLVPRTGLLKNSNATCLNGQPMKADLEKILGVRVEMANDANCFALAETQLGVVKQQFPKARVVFGIILGTGVGGGLVVNGQALDGFHGLAGEWGHNYLNEADGSPCFCGKTGCNESILAGPSLQRYYAKHAGESRSLPDIVARAEAGTDPVAEQTLQRLTTYFGLALSAIVNIIDPDVIVIGGGVGNINRLYTEGVSKVATNVFDHVFETPVVKPSLGDSAGVFGAAYLVA